MSAMKKPRVKVEIDLESGDHSVDILNKIGPTCAKDAEEWANVAGAPKSVTKKPEYFQKTPTKQQITQQNG